MPSSLVIVLLSHSIAILKNRNLERKGTGFEQESILIIISHHLTHIEKKSGGLQVTHILEL
jgi:hypothetical protein